MPFANFEDTQNLINQAKQMFRVGQVPQAVEFLEAKSRQHPQNAELVNHLASLYMRIGYIDQAIKKMRLVLKLKPDNADYLTNLGSLYEQQQDLKHAALYFEKALKIDPENIITTCNLANIYERFNRLDDANELLENLPSKQKKDAYYVITHARIKRHLKKPDAAKADLLALKDKDVEHLRHKILKYNELARISDLLGEYEDAFDYAVKSKEFWCLQPEVKRHPPGEIITLMERLKDIFTRKWTEGWSVAPVSVRPAPVQVVGFPRSGTTLIDQILQAHPSVVGMEEKPAADYLMAEIDKTVNGLYKELDTLTDEQVMRLQNSYFEAAKKYASFNNDQILLDKNPFNIYKIAPMLRVFPDMKTIIMLRHPLDCLLSAYMQNFALNRGTIALSSLQQSAEYYDRSFDLLEHYQRAIPNSEFYMIRYEDLVENPREEIKGLLDFLGLPWDEKVLHFHENEDKDIVTSASYAQVNQPIYKTSLYRWKNYEKQIDSVRHIVQPWIEKFGYTEE